jgi:peptidoglycan-associated lipoprotein
MLRYRSLTLALCLTAVLAVSACGKKKPVAAAPPPPPAPATKPDNPPPPPPPPAPAADTRVPTEEEMFGKMTLDELNAKKPLGDAFFSLDSSELSEDARGALQKDADWLKKWTSTKVTVEGHCDSRGTAEYNLALGERRSTAVKSYLASLGIGADRVLTVSKGKEQPVCSENNEACWSQNRRGHFIITAK